MNLTQGISQLNGDIEEAEEITGTFTVEGGQWQAVEVFLDKNREVAVLAKPDQRNDLIVSKPAEDAEFMFNPVRLGRGETAVGREFEDRFLADIVFDTPKNRRAG
ncbi:MAG: hypothetical protein IH612_17760 [Desulfofustis sp.]|nr:hypothetical protein [Desulfofustis sp.]